MTEKKPAKKRTRERHLLRVVRAGTLPADTGVLVPPDEYTKRRMKERGYKVGDLLAADLTKPRNPGYHRLAHALGLLCSENVDEFTGVDSHAVLKRCQLEARIGCDEMMVDARSVWPRITDSIVEQGGEQLRPAMQLIGTFLKGMKIPVAIPQSLSYASMDQSAFEEVYKGLCRHIAATYFENCDPQAVEDMAKAMPNE